MDHVARVARMSCKTCKSCKTFHCLLTLSYTVVYFMYQAVIERVWNLPWEGKEQNMKAILKSTGERGFAYQNPITRNWWFETEKARAGGYISPDSRRVNRSDLVLIPERDRQ